MARSGTASVDLDMRDVDPALFPNVVSALRQAGIDPERQLVPVAPAAHYVMGGIATDAHARASLGGLYAVGECSCTGLHGANRLASNSLTECFVFGARAARAALAEPAPERHTIAAVSRDAGALAPPPRVSAASREALWRHAGLERDGAGLERLARDEHPLVRLIAASALTRTESRGAHQRTDFPERDTQFDGRHVTIAAPDTTAIETWM
jgi:L-aspartate oxidase